MDVLTPPHDSGSNRCHPGGQLNRGMVVIFHFKLLIQDFAGNWARGLTSQEFEYNVNRDFVLSFLGMIDISFEGFKALSHEESAT